MTSVKLKNYTTTVPAGRSIQEIQEILAEFGAERVVTDYENRQAVGVSFLYTVNNRLVAFKLPIKTRETAEYLFRQYKEAVTKGKKTREDFEGDAYNICWRLMRDWVHSQLSLLQVDMVKIEQVFLPYIMINDKQTLADMFSAGGFNHLLPSGE